MLRPSLLRTCMRLSKEVLKANQNATGKLHTGLTYQSVNRLREVLQQPRRGLASPADSINTNGAPSTGDTVTHTEKVKTDVSHEELLSLLETGDVQLFDVREPKELKEQGFIPGATNIPLTQLKKSLRMKEDAFSEVYKKRKPAKYDNNVVFYGLCEVKAHAAHEIAFKTGYMLARHYPGGFHEWTQKNGKVAQVEE